MLTMDIYQERYLKYQKERGETLENRNGVKYLKHQESFDYFWNVLKSRRSQRIFNDEEIDCGRTEVLAEAVNSAPSSCNRQAVSVKLVDNNIDIKSLGELLVGGSGWLEKADLIFLLFTDMDAYKSPAEIDFMPYLDAGMVVENLYLTAEALNIGSCFVNPNIREENKTKFQEEFNKSNLRFCGAMAFGYYDLKAIEPPKRKVKEIWI